MASVVMYQDSSKEAYQLPIDAAFIAIGHDPNTRLFRGQAGEDHLSAKGKVWTCGSSVNVRMMFEDVFVHGIFHEINHLF